MIKKDDGINENSIEFNNRSEKTMIKLYITYI